VAARDRHPLEMPAWRAHRHSSESSGPTRRGSRFRIHDGEYNDRILGAIDKGLGQLRDVPGPRCMLVVIPQRVFPVEASVLAEHLLGATRSSEDGLFSTHAIVVFSRGIRGTRLAPWST